jgi:hypothetical protein
MLALGSRFEFPQDASSSQFKRTTGYECIIDINIYRVLTQIESYWQQVSEDKRERVRESDREGESAVDFFLEVFHFSPFSP